MRRSYSVKCGGVTPLNAEELLRRCRGVTLLNSRTHARTHVARGTEHGARSREHGARSTEPGVRSRSTEHGACTHACTEHTWSTHGARSTEHGARMEHGEYMEHARSTEHARMHAWSTEHGAWSAEHARMHAGSTEHGAWSAEYWVWSMEYGAITDNISQWNNKTVCWFMEFYFNNTISSLESH